MSFLKNLFGGGDAANDSGDKVIGEEEHNGFTIRAIEMRAGSEFQLCGEISKTVGEDIKVHRFIRADRLSSSDLAASSALAKGRQIIDEQGDMIFR